jgi:hypothetical protein
MATILSVERVKMRRVMLRLNKKHFNYYAIETSDFGHLAYLFTSLSYINLINTVYIT